MSIQKILITFIFMLMCLTLVNCQKDKSVNSELPSYGLSGPYLGQQPPGLDPVRFTPQNLLSDGIWWWHGSPSFSPQGNEMCFVKYISNKSNPMEMYYMKLENNQWTSPQRPEFANSYDNNSPVFNKDGNKILFVSDRDGSRKIYQVIKLENGWSQPQIINFPYESIPGSLGWDISITDDETIYFDIYASNNQLDIYKSRLINGKYSQIEKLPEQINSSYYDWMPYIHPDEKYIIFSSNRPEGFGNHDLYISFENQDGTWTPAKNMGSKINGSSEDSFPSVTPDRKYFFFNSEKAGDRGYNSYWIDAKVIETYK